MEKNRNKNRNRSKKKNETLDLKLFLTNKLFLSKYKTSTDAIKYIYGLGSFYIVYLKKRFEKVNKIYFSSKYNIILAIRILRTFLPLNKDLKFRLYAHLYFFFLIKNYRALRHLQGLPVRGQRTWSNANTQKRSNVDFKKIFAHKAWQIYPFLTRTYSTTAALAEYANYIWKSNWRSEWNSARQQIDNMHKHKTLVKIDLYAMSKFFIRVETGGYKVSKKTKQKRKTEKRLNFTTGFDFNFTKNYLNKSARELRHINMQVFYTKTSRLIKEKEAKTQKKKKNPKLGKGIKSMKVARKLKKKKKKTVWD